MRKVKTLGQLDKAVDLMSFYCDSHVHINNQRRKITSLSDFPQNENILIEGIAGQGKSIFLRYLCAVELYRGQYVPVFVELRKITAKKSLIHQILATLETYNIDLTRKQLGELADSGRLLLLLDAFDEIPEELKSTVIDEIERLALKHERLRILVTSRPESGIHTCAIFTNVRLSNLVGDEYAVVINKISGNAELAEQLVKQVRRHKGGMEDLLQTPLLVTLLVIRYKSYQELPLQMSDFYDTLFQVLLQRHDGSKPGYKRQRKSSLNDMQYRQAFESFCFRSKRHNGKQLTQSIVYELAAEALKERGFECSPEAFIADIIKITCLVVRDGEEHRFIHKSVQEFYSASYIQHKPDVVVQELYKKLFSDKTGWRFTQELNFLNEIDRYRYYKFGELAFLKNFFQISENSFRKSPTTECFAIIRKGLENLIIEISEIEGQYHLCSIQIPTFGPFWGSYRDAYDRMVCDVVMKSQILNKGPELSRASLLSSDKAKRHQIKLCDWPKPIGHTGVSGINLAELSKAITEELFSIGVKASNYVEKEEDIPAIPLD